MQVCLEADKIYFSPTSSIILYLILYNHFVFFSSKMVNGHPKCIKLRSHKIHILSLTSNVFTWLHGFGKFVKEIRFNPNWSLSLFMLVSLFVYIFFFQWWQVFWDLAKGKLGGRYIYFGFNGIYVCVIASCFVV